MNMTKKKEENLQKYQKKIYKKNNVS